MTALKKNKEYIIPFVGLKPGTHRYEFNLDTAFFAVQGIEEVSGAEVAAVLDFDKQDHLMTLHFDFEGWVLLTCDRCAGEYKQPLSGKYRLIVKFGDQAEELSEELVVIGRDEYELDVSPYLYEFVRLLLPIKREHPVNESGQSECDQEVIGALDNLLVNTPEKEEETDPRWDALKNLKWS